MPKILGVDSGGTFTDCVVIDENGQVHYDKALTTPRNIADGVLHSIGNAAGVLLAERTELLQDSHLMAHGTTAGLNRLFTRTGSRTGLITTRGHEDAILIGRVFQKVAGLVEREINYAVRLNKPAPIVPRHLIRGVTERVGYKGQVIVPLQMAEVKQAVAELVAEGGESIAVCLLWSFLTPDHERRIRAYIAERYPQIFVTLSSEVAPVLGEYERTATTAINGYLGPGVSNYLHSLEHQLNANRFGGNLLIMQSSGGCVPAAEASLRAVQLLASGPVGGVVASALMGKAMGYEHIIATDVGGTSFDVGLVVGGAAELTNSPVLDQYEVAVPTVDIVSIGAGGGSIGWVDPASGILHVGPRSAGADPGPACYGNGGTEPTVSDADLLLGRLNPHNFFGGRLVLRKDAAEQAMAKLADRLGMEPVAVAKGMVDIVDAHMADLVRKMTIEKGYDPRDFVLFAYGGMGPTHVGAYARDVGVKAIIVPRLAPVFSAFGIAGSDVMRFYEKSVPMVLPAPPSQVEAVYNELAAQAEADMQSTNFTGSFELARSVGMRLRSQTRELQVPVPAGPLTAAALDGLILAFKEKYEQIYGRNTAYLEAGVELVTFRVTAIGRLVRPDLVPLPASSTPVAAARVGERPVYYDEGFLTTPVYDGNQLQPGHIFSGPAIVESPATTVVIHPGQAVAVDGFLNLIITAEEA